MAEQSSPEQGAPQGYYARVKVMFHDGAGALGDMGRSVVDMSTVAADGLTFGVSGQVMAGLRTLYNGNTYEQNLSRVEADLEAIRENKPIAALAGDVGALSTGAGVIKKAVTAAVPALRSGAAGRTVGDVVAGTATSLPFLNANIQNDAAARSGELSPDELAAYEIIANNKAGWTATGLAAASWLVPASVRMTIGPVGNILQKAGAKLPDAPGVLAGTGQVLARNGSGFLEGVQTVGKVSVVPLGALAAIDDVTEKGAEAVAYDGVPVETIKVGAGAAAVGAAVVAGKPLLKGLVETLRSAGSIWRKTGAAAVALLTVGPVSYTAAGAGDEIERRAEVRTRLAGASANEKESPSGPHVAFQKQAGGGPASKPESQVDGQTALRNKVSSVPPSGPG